MTALPLLAPESLAALAAAGLCLAFISLIVAVLAVRRAGRLEQRFRQLDEHYHVVMSTADGQDLAAALEAYARRLQASENRLSAVEAQAENLNSRLARAITRLRILRYRAFEDAGGDQSFVLALLDESNDGAVVSVIQGRGGYRVYGKPVSGGTSTYNLSNEEARVIVGEEE